MELIERKAFKPCAQIALFYSKSYKRKILLHILNDMERIYPLDKLGVSRLSLPVSQSRLRWTLEFVGGNKSLLT